MSRRIKRIDPTRRNLSVNEEEKRTVLYSWVNRDGSGEVTRHRNLLLLAMYLGCSMLEAWAHAKLAGCYNNGTNIDVIIWTHGWLEDGSKPYVISIEPPNMGENVRLYSTLTFEASRSIFEEEVNTLLETRTRRIYSIEDILGYP